MGDSETFRPWSGFLIAGIVFLMSLAVFIETIFQGNLHSILLGLAWGSVACTTAYLVFIRPKITFFDEGITITNPFDEITVGWDKVEEIEARYCMSIAVGGKKIIYAWAAPGPGRYHARTIHGSEIRGMKIGINGMIRPGESPRTHSGVATYLARLRLENYRNSATVGKVESLIRFNKAGAIILGTSSVLGMILLFIHF